MAAAWRRCVCWLALGRFTGVGKSCAAPHFEAILGGKADSNAAESQEQSRPAGGWMLECVGMLDSMLAECQSSFGLLVP